MSRSNAHFTAAAVWSSATRSRSGGAGGDGFVRGPWPCPICKPRGRWWCRLTLDGAFAWCRNVSDGAISTTRNAYGDEYIHRLTGERRVCAVVAARSAPVGNVEPLAPALLHAMHCYLFGAHLRLPAWARAIVRDRRGLTNDEIDAEGYGYLAREGRKRIARDLLERFGDGAMCLPGMFNKLDEASGANWPSLGGAVGLVVPVRTLVDGEPRIVALKVRALEDNVPPEARFTFVSSHKRGGCKAVVAPHYPARTLALRAEGHREVILVESEIAATVVSCITNRPAVAVAGVSNALRFGPEVARAWPTDVVRVAFDNDPKASTRAKISAIARDLLLALQADGHDGRLLTFPPPAKGPDDHVRALHRPRPTASTGTALT